MMQRPSNAQVGKTLSFTKVVFLVLLVFKLLGKTSLSWWWVTVPLWGPYALLAAIFLGGLALYCFGSFMLWLLERKKRKRRRALAGVGKLPRRRPRQLRG